MKPAFFDLKTPNHTLRIHYLYSFIPKSKVKVDKDEFTEMCKTGCSNYGKKYTCPPHSPDFENIMKNYDELFVLLFFCRLNELKFKNKYIRVIMPNTVMKSRIEKIMRELENITKSQFLGTGSCRLCRPCKLKINQPCKYPKKRRYSLESVGVDCDDLTKKLFNVPLMWYKDKKVPKYTSVVCGLPVRERNLGIMLVDKLSVLQSFC